MNYFFAIITGLLLGSIPSAYLMVKYFSNKDITKEGSGNVGTLNSYEVTNSKLIGAIVFVIDFGKGLASVLFVKIFLANDFNLIVTALIFAVASHCFNPWLNFKGGRGLATAAGGTFLFSPIILISWVILWSVAYLIKKHIHFANITATILTIALTIDSAKIINRFTFPSSDSLTLFRITVTIVLTIILIKHWEPLKNIFIKSIKRGKEKNEKI